LLAKRDGDTNLKRLGIMEIGVMRQKVVKAYSKSQRNNNEKLIMSGQDTKEDTKAGEDTPQQDLAPTQDPMTDIRDLLLAADVRARASDERAIASDERSIVIMAALMEVLSARVPTTTVQAQEVDAVSSIDNSSEGSSPGLGAILDIAGISAFSADSDKAIIHETRKEKRNRRPLPKN
jgi:hypothetical protein